MSDELVPIILKKENKLCPVCGAHKANYLEALGEECWHGHPDKREEK